jgi:PBP1b-binding outer membrane lipoprotein LpoB
MKLKLIAILLAIMLAIAGCSSGNKGKTPEDKIATINSMMQKGYEMSDNQKNKVNQALEQAKKLVSEGNTAEANKVLNKTINMLEMIAETDRFNKSE